MEVIGNSSMPSVSDRKSGGDPRDFVSASDLGIFRGSEPPAFLNSFNLIRFLAAFQIVNGHLFQETLITHNVPNAITVLIASSGSYSTTLFFVLSGIVLAYTRQRRESRGKESPPPFAMFLRHLQRGLPYLLLGAGIHAAKSIYQEGLSFSLFGEFLYSVSFLAPFGFKPPPLNGASWAMSVFVIGYLIDAYFGDKISKKRTSESLVVICLLTGLASLFMLVYCVFLPVYPAYPPRKYDELCFAFHVFPFLRIFEVILGMHIGALLHRHYGQLKEAVESCFSSCRIACILVLIVNASCLALLSAIPGQMAFLATHGLLLVPTCIMLMGLAISDDWVEEYRLVKTFAFLGSLSLPIYLLHLPGMSMYWMLTRLFTSNPSRETWPYMAFFYVFLIAFATGVMYVVNHARSWTTTTGRMIPRPVKTCIADRWWSGSRAISQFLPRASREKQAHPNPVVSKNKDDHQETRVA